MGGRRAAAAYGAGFVDASSVERADWVPDLVTFGKVVGGGMPLAAVAGRADVMDLLAPLGPVYQLARCRAIPWPRPLVCAPSNWPIRACTTASTPRRRKSA